MAYDTSLSVLADPTRRAIYESLRSGARSVGEIASGFPVSRPAVSQHLRTLREAGLVSESREGTRRLYSLEPAAALELRDYFQTMWECAMQRYARHVATEEKRRVRKRRR
jgi:DNA-binding transcriptional ArsR family regulator